MDRFDSLVVGAGVVGLAIARQLAMRGVSVVIVEKEADFGQGISSRNSEVVHAGIYYKPGSLKAITCLEGRDALYQYAEDRHIPYRKTGKLVVATGAGDDDKLEAIKSNAEACGVDGLTLLTRAQVFALEPQVRCNAALLSPDSGIIDSHQLMLSYLADAENHGAVLVCNHHFIRAEIDGQNGFVAAIADENAGEHTFGCRSIVNAAGLGAIDVANAIEGLADDYIPSQHYSLGRYLTHSGKPPFRHLIYPVPEEHGLGIHSTLDLSGRVRFGPDHHWIDEPAYPVADDAVDAFGEAIRQYYPGLEPGSLTPGYAGVRPKISFVRGQSGRNHLEADFVIHGPKTHGIDGLVNLFGIESPGLTAASSLARRVSDLLITL